MNKYALNMAAQFVFITFSDVTDKSVHEETVARIFATGRALVGRKFPYGTQSLPDPLQDRHRGIPFSQELLASQLYWSSSASSTGGGCPRYTGCNEVPKWPHSPPSRSDDTLTRLWGSLGVFHWGSQRPTFSDMNSQLWGWGRSPLSNR